MLHTAPIFPTSLQLPFQMPRPRSSDPFSSFSSIHFSAPSLLISCMIMPLLYFYWRPSYALFLYVLYLCIYDLSSPSLPCPDIMVTVVNKSGVISHFLKISIVFFIVLLWISDIFSYYQLAVFLSQLTFWLIDSWLLKPQTSWLLHGISRFCLHLLVLHS